MPVHSIPAAAEGAQKSWRKTVTGIDPTKDRGFAVQGEFLDVGAAYDLPAGGLILGVDQTPTGAIVTLWTVDGDTLTEVKQLTRKGPWSGKATINAIAKAVAANPWPANTKPRKTAHAANSVAGDCARCRQQVAVGDGVQARNERGYLVVQHHTCPPKPPLRNDYPGHCERCTGWIDVQEGILADRREYVMYQRAELLMPPMAGEQFLALDGFVVLHETCPPPEDRKSAPPVPNRYAEPCALCWQIVAAGRGIYAHGAVTHTDACPDRPVGPTWTVSYGRPGPFNPRPTSGYTVGQVLRVHVTESVHAVPADTPGRRADRGMVSMIGTVVAETKPRYIRDEDGDSPVDLIGSDGWYFQAKVRPATAEEAAGILAAEAEAIDRDALRLAAVIEFVRDGDGDIPTEAPDAILAFPGVRIEERRVGSLAFAASWGAYIHLRVDEDCVWVLRYNGADGDNWSASNAGAYIARRVPLTGSRRELLDRLVATFGPIT